MLTLLRVLFKTGLVAGTAVAAYKGVQAAQDKFLGGGGMEAILLAGMAGGFDDDEFDEVDADAFSDEQQRLLMEELAGQV